MSHYLTIRGIGQAIAYFPKLGKYLGSVKAAIFLGQLIFWHDKTNNQLGVYKSAEEIQEETGLTYKEQISARKTLVDLGLVTETYKRIEHKLYFKFNVEKFDQWFTEVNMANSQDGISRNDNLSYGEHTKGDFHIQKTTTEITTEIRRSTAELTQILKGKKPVEALIAIGLEKDVAQRFNEHRKTLKKPLTLEGLIKHYHESCNAGISTNDAARIVLSESWIGFANRYNWKPIYETMKGESKSAQPEAPQNLKTVKGAW